MAEVREGDPAPDGSGPLQLAGGSRWATSSSSAASTPRRWACRCWTRRRAGHGPPWAPTGSGSPGPSPRSPRAPATRKGCAGRVSWRRIDVQMVAAGKDDTGAAARRPGRALDDAGCGCCWTTARASPGSSSPMPRSWACRRRGGRSRPGRRRGRGAGPSLRRADRDAGGRRPRRDRGGGPRSPCP